MVIFHCYVSSPEGIHGYFMDHLQEDFPMEINHPAIGVSAAGSSLALLLPHLGVQGVTLKRGFSHVQGGNHGNSYFMIVYVTLW